MSILFIIIWCDLTCADIMLVLFKFQMTYHDNVDLPVYYHPLRLDTQEIVNTLLDPDLKDDRICKVQPL